MLKTEVFTGKTVEEAVRQAAQIAGCTVGELQYTVLDESKKGFLGIGAEVSIRADYEVLPQEGARDFLRGILTDMGLSDAVIDVRVGEEGEVALSVTGEHLGAIIGRHGEVMDALQYLTSLVVNRGKGDYVRVVLDVEGYRAKRAVALEALAERMASRVTRTGRAVTLEPMNPYERRIIHSKVQQIAGVTTFSVGDGDDRKVVVAPEGSGPEAAEGAEVLRGERSGRRKDRDRGERGALRRGAPKPEPFKSTVDYAAIAASLPPRESHEKAKVKSIDELPLADVEDTVDVVVDDNNR